MRRRKSIMPVVICFIIVILCCLAFTRASAQGLLGKYQDIVFLEMNSRTIPAVLSLIDVYVRPSRHDGEPRLVVACKRNGIPVYYDPNFKPEVYEMVNFIIEQSTKPRR